MNLISQNRFPTEQKKLILGCCATGAKFTPLNHKETGNRIYDAICCGDTIPTTEREILEDMLGAYKLGCRYYHVHARNPDTREQSCLNDHYAVYGAMAREHCPNMMLSFGASRNGREIIQQIVSSGEWSRISQIALDINSGGAEFVTAQAAVELQIVCDLQRQDFVELCLETGDHKILKPLSDYRPDMREKPVRLEVNSTEGGSNYGSSSPALQLKALKRAISIRLEMNLPFEVEWVQRARSALLTRLLIHELGTELSEIGRLNVTLLFGFSPRLPFPNTYHQFKEVVDLAHSCAFKEGKQKIAISVSVGAAMLPHLVENHLIPMDVGPLIGKVLSPAERLGAYAAQPDSGVDLVRTGMEDTPFIVDSNHRVLPATNQILLENIVGILNIHGVEIETDRNAIDSFATRKWIHLKQVLSNN